MAGRCHALAQRDHAINDLWRTRTSSVPEKFLFCFAATMLTLFIAGLLYLLRFDDRCGAVRHAELIPSDNNT